MKELSIEEKARRYDEAIKRLEDIETGKCQKTFMFTEGLFDYIFPEFKESEDERIRKEIIAHIKWCEDSGYCAKEEMTRWITWLEKQAQKPFGFNNSDTIDHNLNDYCCKIYSDLHKENGGVLSFARLQHLAMDIYGWCKEQGERKPSWSEKDKAHIDSLLKRLEGMCKPNATFISTEFAISEDEDWLKSLRPQNRWKPSEEMLEALYRAIPENVMAISKDEMLLDKLYQGLKYGRVLSKN